MELHTSTDVACYRKQVLLPFEHLHGISFSKRTTNTGCVSNPVGLARQARRGWTTATRGTTAARTRRRAGCARRGWRAMPRSRPGATARSPRTLPYPTLPAGPAPARAMAPPPCALQARSPVPASTAHMRQTYLPPQRIFLMIVLRSELGPGQGSAGGACACQVPGACAGPRPVLVCGPVLTPWAGLAAGRPGLCCLRCPH